MPAITFLGFYVAQSRGAISKIMEVLDDNPDIMRIVELGTGSGGLTLLFGLYMTVRGGRVLSFDTYAMPDAGKWFERLSVDFHCQDIFTGEAFKLIREFSGQGRMLLFCDNGDKPLELSTYVQAVKPNDLVMVHDYPQEITGISGGLEDILEPYRQEEFDAEHTFILSMRRK